MITVVLHQYLCVVILKCHSTLPGLITFLAISKCTNTLNWKYSVYIIAVY